MRGVQALGVLCAHHAQCLQGALEVDLDGVGQPLGVVRDGLAVKAHGAHLGLERSNTKVSGFGKDLDIHAVSCADTRVLNAQVLCTTTLPVYVIYSEVTRMYTHSNNRGAAVHT